MKKALILAAVVFALAYFWGHLDPRTAGVVAGAVVVGVFMLRLVLSQTRAGRKMRVRNPITGRLGRRRAKREKKEKRPLDERPAILYIVTHRGFNAVKIGIGDGSESRVTDHESEGWRLRRIYRGLSRSEAYDVEQAVLRSWRNKGYRPAVDQSDMPQGGYTETVSLKKVDLDKLCDRVDKMVGVDSRRRLWR